MLKIYKDKDADLSLLKGKSIAVLGYGSQGSAQAFMLKKSGVDVIVGLRKKSSTWKKAVSEGQRVMDLSEAASKADIVHMLVPDEVQAEVFEENVKPYLKKGKTLCFSHGFNIAYGLIKPPKEIDVIMVAPIAPGIEEKRLYLEDKGVPAYIAIHQNKSGQAKKIALAMAKAMKFTKTAVMEVSFKQETFTDLFGEQVVVCGGLSELIRRAFDTLTAAGYPQEMAYFECLHQSELLARMIREGGIGGMWNRVSNTAEFGGRIVGPQIINSQSAQNMKKVLKRVENGEFAKELIQEFKSGMKNFKKMRAADKRLPIEIVGERLRHQLKKAPLTFALSAAIIQSAEDKDQRALK